MTARRSRLVRRRRGGASATYTAALVVLVAGLVAGPWGVTASLIGDRATNEPLIRQATFGAALLGLALVTAGMGLTLRGDPFGVLSAGRNRYSLSRLQMALWSWVVIAAVIAVAACRAWGLGGAAPGSALVVQVDRNLLAVMGISYFTAAATPGLLSLKAAGSNQRPAVTVRTDVAPIGVRGQLVYRPTEFEARLVDLVYGEEASNAGSIDLSKLQQLAITVTLVAVYAIMLLNLFGGPDFVTASGADEGATKLPELSSSIVELLLVSHAGYLGYSAVSKPPPASASDPIDDGPPPTPGRASEL